MQTHNSPIKAIREKCLECSCIQNVLSGLSENARGYHFRRVVQ